MAKKRSEIEMPVACRVCQQVPTDWDWCPGGAHIVCQCGVSGPAAPSQGGSFWDCVAAWNAMWKAAGLQLTDEPPKAAGYYWNKIGDAAPYITEFLPRDVGKPNIPGIMIAGPIPLPSEAAR